MQTYKPEVSVYDVNFNEPWSLRRTKVIVGDHRFIVSTIDLNLRWLESQDTDENHGMMQIMRDYDDICRSVGYGKRGRYETAVVFEYPLDLPVCVMHRTDDQQDALEAHKAAQQAIINVITKDTNKLTKILKALYK